MTAHPNSSAWCLSPKRRKGHLNLTDLAKPDYTRELAIKAAWVAEWEQAAASGDTERARELEGLLGTSPISELAKKGK